MSYADDPAFTYVLASHDFGAGAGTGSIKAPVGKTRGRILDIGITNITEAFTDDTTAAYFQVGDGTDVDKYCQLEVANGTGSGIGDTYNTRDDTDAIIEADIIVSDLTGGQLEFNYVAPTGGTPAGIGSPYIAVRWY
jgi:hypothetical protein